jgi:hypothetical protein
VHRFGGRGVDVELGENRDDDVIVDFHLASIRVFVPGGHPVSIGEIGEVLMHGLSIVACGGERQRQGLKPLACILACKGLPSKNA